MVGKLSITKVNGSSNINLRIEDSIVWNEEDRKLNLKEEVSKAIENLNIFNRKEYVII